MSELRNIESPWAKVPIDLLQQPGITLADLSVYICLDYAAGKRGYWHGTQGELAEASGIVERTVRRAVTKLERLEYIETRRLGIENRTALRYWVLARSLPIDEAEQIADEEIRPTGHSDPVATPPSGQGDPVGRTRMSARTISKKDLSTDTSLIDDAFVDTLVQKHRGILSEEEVQEAVKDALAHKNRLKWDDKRRYVSGWVGRAATWKAERGPNRRPAFNNDGESRTHGVYDKVISRG